MPELDFHVDQARAVPFAASPQIGLTTRVVQVTGADAPRTRIHTVALRCQVRLEPGRRRYTPGEQEKLHDLFGEPERWGQTVRSLMWAETSVMVPGFVDEAKIDLPLPCTYDFNVATCKYFYALDDGVIPLGLLFSGTIFYAGDDGHLQIEQISWEKEATFGLPVAVWKDMMEQYYPNCAWLNLRRDVFDRLYRFKSRRALPTWEKALETLLAEEMVAT